MKVYESLEGIFQEVEKLYPNSEVFDFVDSESLDLLYLNSYGNRKVTKLVENAEIESVAKIVGAMYMDSWNSIILNYLESKSLLKDYQEIVTENTNSDSEYSNTSSNTNKVSAYDNDDFVNNDELTIQDDNKRSDNYNREMIKTKLKTSSDYASIFKYLTNFNIYNIMMLDINKVLTLNILGGI